MKPVWILSFGLNRRRTCQSFMLRHIPALPSSSKKTFSQHLEKNVLLDWENNVSFYLDKSIPLLFLRKWSIVKMIPVIAGKKKKKDIPCPLSASVGFTQITKVMWELCAHWSETFGGWSYKIHVSLYLLFVFVESETVSQHQSVCGPYQRQANPEGQREAWGPTPTSCLLWWFPDFWAFTPALISWYPRLLTFTTQTQRPAVLKDGGHS